MAAGGGEKSDDIAQLTSALYDLFKDVTVAVLREKPRDVVDFVANHFTRLRDNKRRASVPFYVVVDDDDLAVEPDRQSFLPKTCKGVKEGRRTSVAGESYNPEADIADDNSAIIARHPKTAEQQRRLTEAVKHILLFRSLDDELMARVIEAMFERKVQPGDYVIRQGDDGDNFYVIETGSYDVIIKRANDINSPGQCVLRLNGRGSFGELALMYNQPRTASVVAVTSGTLWAMERHSFRRIVLRSAHEKREMYKQVLSNVPMLRALDDYERATLADALRPQTYPDGACIVREGDRPADGMYFIEKGAARVTMKVGTDPYSTEKTVAWLGVGDYFGEMALLEDGPRTASVYASCITPTPTGARDDLNTASAAAGVGDGSSHQHMATGPASSLVTVAFLERESFERLLGPCVDIMRRKSLTYTRSLSGRLVSSMSDPDNKLDNNV